MLHRDALLEHQSLMLLRRIDRSSHFLRNEQCQSFMLNDLITLKGSVRERCVENIAAHMQSDLGFRVETHRCV